MADPAPNTIGAELGSVPIGDLIRTMAMSIADAQFELDRSSVMVAEYMSGQRLVRPDELPAGTTASGPQLVDTRVYFGYSFDESGQRVPAKASMMELGFTPTFYQFVDTVIEVRLALRIQRSGQSDGKTDGSTLSGSAALPGRTTGFTVAATPVDATYSATYSFSADMACVFRTKIVPIPPPVSLDERLRQLAAREAQAAAPPPDPAK